jgi:uncharacterized damage-inducible protein DinB
MNDAVLREQLVELLKGGQAHLTLDEALANLDPKLRSVRAGGSNSIWAELEHMRIAQEDILRYTLDPNWESPAFPDGFWPTDEVTDQVWQTAITRFKSDLHEVIDLAGDTRVDLTAEIPHGEGRTYLREILLVADHNVYHLGQIVTIRKALGAWHS